MYRHQCIAQVAANLDLVLPDEINPDIVKSALTQARQRLRQEPLSLLFGMSAATRVMARAHHRDSLGQGAAPSTADLHARYQNLACPGDCAAV